MPTPTNDVVETDVLLYPSWWRHQMETFSAFLAICAGNSPVPGEFPAQRPVTRSFDVFFICARINGFETPSCPFWCYCNVSFKCGKIFSWLHFTRSKCVEYQQNGWNKNNVTSKYIFMIRIKCVSTENTFMFDLPWILVIDRWILVNM